MNRDVRRRLAPIAFIVAGVLLLATAGWGIIHRQLDLYVQIGLALTVGLVALGVLLDPARLRAVLQGRQARYGSNAILVSLAVTGILSVITYLAITNTRQVDLTEDQEYTLTAESQLVLSGLQQPVTLLGFFTPEASSSREYVRPLLDQYQRAGGGKVAYEFVDPRADPVSADRYGVTRDATVVVVMGEESEITPSTSEKEITSAIVRLSSPEPRKIYFLTGHGEHVMDATDASGYRDVTDVLEAKNYEVAALSLLSESTVPEDAKAVLIAGPTSDLPRAEMQALEDYVADGGSLVVLLEPPAATEVTGQDALVPYLASDWGVEARADLVVDLNSNVGLAAVAYRYASHPITERLSNQGSYFPSARSLVGTEAAPSALTELVVTGADAWGKTDEESILAGSFDYVEGEDTPGPLTVAMAAEDAGSGARLVVVGDSDFAANGDFYNYANGDVLINSIDWAAHHDELISLTPKQSTPRYVTPPTTQVVGLIFLLTILVIPGAVVVAGVLVWLRRRRQT